MPRTKQCADCGTPIYPGGLRCKSCAKKGALNNRFGVEFTPETRAKIGARQAGPKPWKRGELNPMWTGANISKDGGRERARRLYPQQPCHVCGVEKTERHHVDANTRNNAPENILHLCRPHHRQIHPGHGPRPLRAPRWAPVVERRYVYTDRDGVGTQDPAIRAYGCQFLGKTCTRAGAWWRGKALVRFEDGSLVVVRARLLRLIRNSDMGTARVVGDSPMFVELESA